MGRNGDTGQCVFFLKQLIMETLVNFLFTLHYSRRNGLGYFDHKGITNGKEEGCNCLRLVVLSPWASVFKINVESRTPIRTCWAAVKNEQIKMAKCFLNVRFI